MNDVIGWNTGAAPGARANAAVSGAAPLLFARPGEEYRVACLKGSGETRRHLSGLGFVEGAPVSVVSSADGSVIACVKGCRVALGRQMAQRILVVT